MSRYIDADKCRQIAIERTKHFADRLLVIGCIEDTPTEEVAPVVHAYNKSKDSFLCSACTFGDFGLFNHGGKYTPKYCPNCGARMDGGRNDG